MRILNLLVFIGFATLSLLNAESALPSHTESSPAPGPLTVSNYAGAAYFFGEGSIWNSTSNATGAPDGSGSTVFVFPGNSSRYLFLRNFGFNLPCNATIESITVNITRQNGAMVNARDFEVALFNPNELRPGLENHADPSTWVEDGSWETVTYTDMDWGENLTAEMLNDQRFGLVVSVENFVSSGRAEPSIDAVEMEVCYSLSGVANSSISFTVDKTSACFNEGSMTINATGGSGTFEYSIDAGMTWQPSNLFTGLSTGDYLVVVRNADMTCQTELMYCNLSSDQRILQPGDGLVTCATYPGNRVTMGVDKLQAFHDLYVAGETGYDISGFLPAHPYKWTVDDLGGEVFSTDIDEDRNIYTATTMLYDLVPGAAVDVIVSKIDGVSAVATQLATLPGDAGAVGVEYVDACDNIFVANLSDGRIYRIDGTTGATLSTYDPFTADNGAAGMAPLGERVMGVTFNPNDNRLYYSMWNSDFNMTGIRNTIRSVALDPSTCEFLPATDIEEIVLPWTSEYGDLLNPDNYSMPVTDMEFSADGNTLIMGESGFDSTVPRTTPHESRAMRYLGSSGSWTLQNTIPAGNTVLEYELGEVSQGLNARGGVAFANAGFSAMNCSIDDETFIVATADALRGADCNTIGCLYGLQYLPVTGGNSMGSVLLDIGRDLESQQKGVFGDIDIVSGCRTDEFCCPDITSSTSDFTICPGDALTPVDVTSQADSVVLVYHTSIPADSVAVYNNGTPIDTADVVGGIASLSLTDLPTGTPGVVYLYVLSHPIPTEDFCRPYDSLLVNVRTLPVVNITDPVDECLNGSDMIFTGTPFSGSGSGSFTSPSMGLTNNNDGTATLDIVTAGVGLHDVTYTYTDGFGCVNSAMTTVEVFDIPTLTLSDPVYGCLDGAPMPFSATPVPSVGTTGVFSTTASAGLIDNGDGTATLNPMTAGIGNYDVTYTFTDANGCIVTETVNVDVIDCDLDVALIMNTSQTTPVQLGDVVTYDITVCNQGTNIIDSLEITSYLPSCHGFSSNNGWVTSGSDVVNTITVTNGGLPVGGLLDASAAPNNCVTIQLDLSVDCGDVSNLIAYAEVSGHRNTIGGFVDVDSSPGSNTLAERSVLPGDLDDDSFNDATEDDHDPATMPVVDIALRNTLVSAGPFTYGQNIQFQIELFNQGNVDLSNIEVTDYIPCGFAYALSNDPLWSESGGLATTTVSSLAAGASTTVLIDLELLELPGACDPALAWINEAEVSQMFLGLTDVSSLDFDSDSDNVLGNDAGGLAESASDDAISGDGTGAIGGADPLTDEDDHDPALFQFYDLMLSKSVTSSGPYGQDSIVTYALVVENQGNIAASNIEVSDFAQPGLIYQSSDAASNANVTETSSAVWSIANLAPGRTETINVQFIIGGSFQGLNLANSVAITADDGDDIDSDPSTDNTVDEDGDGDGDDDDEDSQIITVEQYYDLALNKTEISTGPYFQGSTITYEIEIVNEGTLNASNIRFEDEPATGLIYQSDNSGSNANVTMVSPLIYEVSSLAFGNSETIQISFTVDPLYQGITIANSAQITVDDGVDRDSDPDTDETVDEDGDLDGDDDDEDSVTVDVEQTYDLSFDKVELSTGPYIPGSFITYRLDINNEGTLNASNIQFQDTPGVGLTYVSDNSASNPNVNSLGSLTFEVLSLAFGNTESLEITFQVDPVYQDITVTNFGQITVDDGDDEDSDPDTDETFDEDGDGDGFDDDEDELIIDVQQTYDLSIEKRSLTTVDIYPGDQISFSITVNNEGTLNAANIDIAENPGAGLIYIGSTAGSDPNIIEQNPNLFTITSLPAYTSTSFEVTYEVPLGYVTPTASNQVEIITDDGDDVDSDPDTSIDVDEDGDGDGFDDDEAESEVIVIVGYDIGDFVWEDMDGDGIQDFNEPGLENVRVTLRSNQGFFVDVTFTDANGYYLFEEVFPGNYYLEITMPDGYSATLPFQGNDAGSDNNLDNSNGVGTTPVFNLNDDDLTIDMGVYKCIPFGEYVWFDYNENDIRDDFENGINGLKVELYRFVSNTWILWDFTYTGHKPGTPSDDGYYKFCVAPGRYYLRFVNPPESLVPVVPNRGGDEDRDSDLTARFGNGTTDEYSFLSGDKECSVGAGFYTMGTIGDFVWMDQNENGLRDNTETGVPGVLVRAINPEGIVMSSSVTDENGQYMIDYLGRDIYYLQFEMPLGLTMSLANVGSDDSMDSDVDGSNGYGTTKFFPVEPGQHVANVDAGLVFAVLPVEWQDFQGAFVRDHNALEWSVSSEVNVSHYEIERTDDLNGDFEMIDETAFKESQSTINTYAYDDYAIEQAKIYYYRIKQIDLDGKFSYSRIITIKTGDIDATSSQLRLYPNPAVESFNVELQSPIANQNYSLDIIDASGRLVKTISLGADQLVNGKTSAIDVSDINPGIYNVKITQGELEWNKKLVILE